MSLLKEPYDPEWVRINEYDAAYETRYAKYMQIQMNKSKLTWSKAFPPLALGIVTGVVAFLWTPLFLLLNFITLMVWIAAPNLRPIQQITQNFLLQKGKGYWAETNAPSVNWTKYNANEFYRHGVVGWIEAVRLSGDVEVNRKDWAKYLREMEQLADKDLALMPDTETLKAMKEVMGK